MQNSALETAVASVASSGPAATSGAAAALDDAEVVCVAVIHLCANIHKSFCAGRILLFL